MAYKWKPSRAQRRDFAQKMQDEDFAREYNERKTEKAQKKRKQSAYNYETAGGQYVPTQNQHDNAFKFLGELSLTDAEQNACNMVISGYVMNEKTHHDHIHIVNELARKI